MTAIGRYQIVIRKADGVRHHDREIVGDLGQACAVALDLADRRSSAEPLAPDVRWIDLYEGERLHISIAVMA